MIDQILSKRKADVDDNLNPRFLSAIPEDCEHPASTPIYWISKWVDYSDKYGIGYQLCDNSVGKYPMAGSQIVARSASANGGASFEHHFEISSEHL